MRLSLHLLLSTLSGVHALVSTVTVTSTVTANTAIVTASLAANTTSTSTTTVTADQCSLTPVVTVTTTLTDSGTSTSTTTVIYTPTTVTTSISTPTCSLPPTTCNNTGLQYAKLAAPSATSCSVKDSVYCANYQPADYKTVTPQYTGVVPYVGGFATFDWQGSFSVYNHTIPARYFILDHRGYFFAPQTGTYTFKFPLCDDKCWLWLGAYAYSGWNASNANDYVVYTALNKTNVYNYTMTQNTYTPFRMYFTQGNGPVNLTMTITGPDGTVLSTPGDAGTYFVQQSCDNVTAPAYAPWGHET